MNLINYTRFKYILHLYIQAFKTLETSLNNETYLILKHKFGHPDFPSPNLMTSRTCTGVPCARDFRI